MRDGWFFAWHASTGNARIQCGRWLGLAFEGDAEHVAEVVEQQLPHSAHLGRLG